jgi:hypothetical protein
VGQSSRESHRGAIAVKDFHHTMLSNPSATDSDTSHQQFAANFNLEESCSPQSFLDSRLCAVDCPPGRQPREHNYLSFTRLWELRALREVPELT